AAGGVALARPRAAGGVPMKLGVMAASLSALGWERALEFCRALGLDAIELPTGGYARSPLIDAAAVLADAGLRRKLLDDVSRHGLVISALSCHGNPVHPDESIAKAHERDQDTAGRLAAQQGAGGGWSFSGCPRRARGGAP